MSCAVHKYVELYILYRLSIELPLKLLIEALFPARSWKVTALTVYIYIYIRIHI